MTKQILKVAAMLMLIAGLTAASATIANGQGTKRLSVNVPFDFNVGERAVPAGQYDVVIPSSSSDALTIRNREGKDRVMILGHAAERRSNGNMIAKLVFHRYGSTYFLSQAWMSGDSRGSELAKTKQESALERELGKIAAYHRETKPLYEVVEVIATLR